MNIYPPRQASVSKSYNKSGYRPASDEFPMACGVWSIVRATIVRYRNGEQRVCRETRKLGRLPREAKTDGGRGVIGPWSIVKPCSRRSFSHERNVLTSCKQPMATAGGLPAKNAKTRDGQEH